MNKNIKKMDTCTEDLLTYTSNRILRLNSLLDKFEDAKVNKHKTIEKSIEK